MNNSIVFDKNVVLQAYIFTDVFSTDLQIEYRIFLYGDIVYWSVISIFIQGTQLTL